MDEQKETQSGKRLWYVWDYDIDEETFQAMLDGKVTIGRLGRDWAAVRLLEYAPYQEIISRIGFPILVQDWSQWRNRLRSDGRRRGFDFLVKWLPNNHPELFQKNG